jgi:Arc/MetJ family transcription regulator
MQSGKGSSHEQPRHAKMYIKRMLRYHTSISDYVSRASFSNTRKYYEALSLAQAIDAFRAEGVDHKYEGVEILVRRLVGLKQADEMKDDSFLSVIAWSPREALVPQDLLRRHIKDVERLKKLKPSADKWRRGKRTGGGPSKPSTVNIKPSDQKSNRQQQAQGSGASGGRR